jgi:hypothetical protein
MVMRSPVIYGSLTASTVTANRYGANGTFVASVLFCANGTVLHMDAAQHIESATALFDTAPARQVNEACTRAVCRLVEERYGPSQVSLETTDQAVGRGFWIVGVVLADGTELDDDAIEDLDDDAFEVVTSIDWSFLPVDRGGLVTISTADWPAT